MRKRDLVSAWVKDAAKNIVRDEDSWRKYLNTASRIYKYPFWEQLCIYAQRPDAEACAPIEVWNNIMHCWVNKGAKGIALLDEKEFITGLKYVFDISDVHMSEKNGRLPYLWTMKEEHEGVVIRRLEKFYGETIKESGFIDRIREMAGRMAEDTCEQVVRDMEYLCHGSYLEEYDELNFRLRIRETLSESIAYTILRRCGVQEAELVDEISFPYIFEFNTVSTLSVLGDSISNQVKSVLMEIGKIIRAYDREHGKEYTAQKSENKVQNRLERTTANDYNTLKRESEAGIQKEEEKEKGAQDGTEIREKRRLPDSGTGDGRAAGRDAGKIRTDAGKLSEGTPERDLYGTSSGRETERTSVNGSGTGAGKDGIADRADEKAEGSGREPQSQRPDALGSGNERHQAVGRGNRAVGADIQLNREVPKPEDAASSGFSYDNSFKAPSQNNGGRKSGRRGKREAKQQKEEYVQLSLFPSVEEQVDEILYGRTETGNFSFQMLPVPDEVIDNILCTGSGMKGSRERIFAKFQERIGTSEIIKFLAEEYGTGGKGFHAGGQAISVWFDGEGIRFAYGVSARGESAVFLTWEMAEERIRSMIDRNIYGEKGEVWREDFITQDEIDAFLIRGGGVNSKLRIYEQFIENYFPNENIKFLKKEYGQGGFDNALPGVEKSYADYSAKGMWLTKGSLLEPEIELLLTWQTVEKYIRELVSTDRYLSQRETEKYIRYKREQWEADTAYEGNREPEKSPEQTEGDGGKAEPANFRITLKDSPKEERKHSAKETFWMNVEAIKLLKQIEGERRNAGPEEQKVLSEYAGWGGLQDAFNESKGEWREEYRELQNLLTEKEYAQARASILNAYYTPDAVIEAIYKVVGQTGFSKGRILEPSMGNGKFFGLLPEEMRESGLYGMEVDSLTGRIAKQLYPNASITIAGFEETSYPDNFFDLVVGNVPFGGYKVADKQYDKYHFLIHDYFLAKAIDKTKRGGIIAVVTTNGMGGGTFDKKDDRARRYFAQRCDLLGAIRLPERTFEHTEVATDILFFQKRERQRDLSADLPEWVETSVVYQGDYVKENGETVPIKLGMNNYFLQYPEMVLGRQEVASGPFGLQLKCLPKEGDFKEKLTAASARIHGHIKTVKLEEAEKERNEDFLPAEPEIKNYSYTLVENRLYYREDAFLKPVKAAETVEKRIRGMLSIRDCVQELLAVQLEDFPESAVREKQEELGKLYDKYVEEFGRINGRANRLAFGEDSGYYLLCSLEMLDEEGYFTGKADIFTKRTIKKRIVITSADTPGEALAISLNEKGKIDLGYMSSLTGQGEEEIINGLAGVIFKNPVTEKWETADEYLSGNVRKKLETARVFAENRPEYAINVSSLEKVQPKELEASEIEVTLGATWIEPEYVRDFMREIFQIPNYYFERELIDIQYIEAVGQWIIKGKNVDRNNALTKSTYGTERADGYRILEDTLNLKSTRVYDIVKTDGEEKRVLNRTETMLAGQKQETIREAFKEWIFMEPERRRALCEKYNRLFNAIRPREYDGSHLTFPAMSPEYRLEPYQMNAVAHQIYGHNTLLAHCVGAGKTFEMVAAAMESKRLGLCSKSLFVVPNHLIMQWAGDFLRLYPGANILAVTKKDFKPDNRKKFCSRIAMGDYDAIIIGHSMFEKIPISHERQADMIERQIREVQEAIGEMNAAKGEKQGIKQMEKTRKSLEARLKKLNDNTRKDDVITFEQLGVDRLFVDESHFYKNLFLHTKMRNVAGISQAEAQKSSDMFAKCQYMDDVICCEL